MALYTIADLHLPLGINKPMDIFGSNWSNYVERIYENWNTYICENDTVILPGDFSWATYLEQSYKDFDFLNKLPGIKILLKGNHDYWWSTISKLNKFISDNNFKNIYFLHNNHYTYKDVALCGTRGWMHPKWNNITAEDRKIFDREILRLKLSLDSAAQIKRKFVFLHYPPTSVNGESNELTELMEQYGVELCCYGHLHSHAHKNAINGVVRGIEYKLTAGDYIDFNPVKLLD